MTHFRPCVAMAFIALAFPACSTSRTVTVSGIDYPEVFDSTLTAVRGSVSVTETDREKGTIRGETDSTLGQAGATIRVTIDPPTPAAATYEVRILCSRKMAPLSIIPFPTNYARVLGPLIRDELQNHEGAVVELHEPKKAKPSS